MLPFFLLLIHLTLTFSSSIDLVPLVSSFPKTEFFDVDQTNMCFDHQMTTSATFGPSEFNLHIVAGKNAYDVAWSHVHDSSKFRSSMVQSIKHFRIALETCLNHEHDSKQHMDQVMWNLGVTIAYVDCRLAVVDFYKFDIAKSWNDALILPIQRSMMNKKLAQANAKNGLIIECGVGGGTTINIIHNELLKLGDTTTTIHGFDSFMGLPSSWGGKGSLISKQFPAGYFSLNGEPPKNLPSRVELHVGMIDKTMPRFIEKQLKEVDSNSYILFLHVDVDIYTSAFEVLASCVCLFIKGTVIEFDEALGYLDYKTSGEYKAFMEIVDLFDIKWKPVTTFKMRMSVEIVSKNNLPACIKGVY
jgi:hypothetical protein